MMLRPAEAREAQARASLARALAAGRLAELLNAAPLRGARLRLPRVVCRGVVGGFGLGSYSLYTALQSPAFYRGVALISGTIASLPLKTYRNVTTDQLDAFARQGGHGIAAPSANRSTTAASPCRSTGCPGITPGAATPT